MDTTEQAARVRERIVEAGAEHVTPELDERGDELIVELVTDGYHPGIVTEVIQEFQAQGTGELNRMRDLLLNAQRRARKAFLSLVVTVVLAMLCAWTAALPAQSAGMRCLLAVVLVLDVGAAVTWSRQYRLARGCRKSYQWQVDWLERGLP